MIAASETHPPLILLADDDRSVRSLLRLAMEEEGYTVAETNNGEQCLAQFKRLQPDMVLLDGMMPLMDGFTCCSQLRRLPGGEHTPVLMITVLDDTDSVDRAFEAGATDYVTKPLHWAVLRQRVSRLLQASQALKQVGQVTEALRQQSLQEQLFRGMVRRLARSLTLEEMLYPSIREICQLLNVEVCLLYHKNGQISLEICEDPSGSSAVTSISPTERQNGGAALANAYTKAFEAGEVVAIAELQQSPLPDSCFQDLARANIKAALSAPIRIRGEWWGILAVYQGESRMWEAREVELLVDVANLMAVAIAQSL